MFNFLKCGTGSLRRAALGVALIDMICSSLLLILFVLGSSVMVAFEFVGNKENATKTLDEITDEFFDGEQSNFSTVAYKQDNDVVEDMGVFLIFMFLTVVDFIISYIFFDGVKSKNANKCQTWLDIRIIIIVIFIIVVVFNIVYGAAWPRYLPEVAFATYRVIGWFIGHGYLKELRETEVCSTCNARIRKHSATPSGCSGIASRKLSVINLAFKRKDVKNTMNLEPPIVTVTGPEESGRTTPIYPINSSQSSPSVQRVAHGLNQASAPLDIEKI